MDNNEELVKIALAVMNSEAMMWLMVGANHQEIWLKDLRKAYMEYTSLGGGYGKATHGNINTKEKEHK